MRCYYIFFYINSAIFIRTWYISLMNRVQRPASKAGKKQKNLYLSDQARQLLAIFSLNLGVSETAVVELLIREKAARENVTLPTEEFPAAGAR